MYLKITVILNFVIFAFIGIIALLGRDCGGEGCLIWALAFPPALIGVISVICTGLVLIGNSQTSKVSSNYRYLLAFISIIYICLIIFAFTH